MNAKRSSAEAEPFVFADERIEPGEKKTIELPVAFLYNHANLTMPVHVVHGRRPGPRLFVSAALHGDELNGTEIVHRLLRGRSFRGLRGTLLAVPVVNVYGFLNRSRYLPDRRDLNRSFPGSESGSLAARLAHLFMTEVVTHCSYGIDLHTGASFRTNLPQVRAQLDDPETERMARSFGAPVVLDSALRTGSLREAAEQVSATVIVYEGGEALRFDELAIQSGVRGVQRVMRELGMLPPARGRVPRRTIGTARTSVWVRAPQSGILRNAKRLGDRMEKGQQMGLVSDPFGGNEIPVESPMDGIIIGQTTIPLAHEGEALFHLAGFGDLARVEAGIERLRQDHDEEINP